MNESTILSQKTFDIDAQRRFATVSGDKNPLHLDAIAARRTQAGAPVVHGIHLLLWVLDTLAAGRPSPPPMRTVRARFSKFVYVGQTADILQTERTTDVARLSVSVNGVAVSQVVIEFGEIAAAPDMSEARPGMIPLPSTALEIDFEDIVSFSGRLPFATPPENIGTMFPAAAAWVSPRRLAALAASTNMVGMVCPGLYSLFSSLSVQACREPNPEDTLEFRVVSTEPRYRLVRITIAGGGVAGTIESFARLPPASQASMVSLAGMVSPNEFAGSTALIVGGSRGLGELTAKLVATGGGRAIITYQVGKADAEKVASEINGAGRACDLIAYDARQSAKQQLASLVEAPTHLYYFATPAIFARQSEMYARERLDEFLEIYVDGFARLVQELQERRTGLSVFYPSSVAIDERPRGMTEYAMAKATGEILCAEMGNALAPLHVLVKRLPRMITDQTASFIPVETSSALDTMLPLVREVQSWPKAPA